MISPLMNSPKHPITCPMFVLLHPLTTTHSPSYSPSYSPFQQGCVVELNNQAKHAVTNGMTDTWRIHLIFDYVESHPLIRYVLKPGEKLNQTRRSIDLARHEGTRQVPSFIVIGAQKCGTTSLYELLCEHPLVVRGKRRDTFPINTP